MNCLRGSLLLYAVAHLLMLWNTPLLVASGQQALSGAKHLHKVSSVAKHLQSLQQALQQKDATELQSILTQLKSLDEKDANGLTLMHYAALQGLLPVTELLQILGASFDITNKQGLLPADFAEFGGHQEVANFMRGIKPATVDLFTAAATNDQRALERLQAEPDINLNEHAADGKTALHWSALHGHLYATQFLIAAGIELMTRDNDGKLAFDLAAEAGHAEVASVLLEATAGLNMKDFQGWTPINWAVVTGDKQRVRQLLDKGAKVGEGCQNAIEVCLIMRDMEMFYILLEAGGIDAASRRGDTALMGSSKRGDEEVVDILLEHRANTNVFDFEHGNTPLRLAGEEGFLSIVLKLIAHGAKLDTLDILGDTALIRTAARGKSKVVEALLAAGAKINIVGAGGMTALAWAVYWNELPTVQALLAGAANLHLRNHADISALGWAAGRHIVDVEILQKLLIHMDTTTRVGREDLRSALIRITADDPAAARKTKLLTYYLNNKDSKTETAYLQRQARDVQDTLAKGMLLAHAKGNFSQRLKTAEKYAAYPLHWAITNKKQELLKKMLALDFALEAKNSAGATAVIAAAKLDSPLLETLLSHGADPNQADDDGNPPIILATHLGHKQSVKTLLAWRADPNAVDSNGTSVLMLAAAAGYLEIVEPLLLDGADATYMQQNGDDALALAEHNGHHEIAKILHAAQGGEK